MNEEMDEEFEYFYMDNGFGPPIVMQLVPSEKSEKFRGKLPDQLLKYWELYGWCGYGTLELKNLRKVGAIEYMMILDQLSSPP